MFLYLLGWCFEFPHLKIRVLYPFCILHTTIVCECFLYLSWSVKLPPYYLHCWGVDPICVANPEQVPQDNVLLLPERDYSRQWRCFFLYRLLPLHLNLIRQESYDRLLQRLKAKEMCLQLQMDLKCIIDNRFCDTCTSTITNNHD